MNRPAETEHITPCGMTVRIMDKGFDRTTSKWFKSALASALARDPVDAANDAEKLAEFLAWPIHWPAAWLTGRIPLSILVAICP